MSDKEKLLKYINEHDGSFEKLIFGYIRENKKDFPTSRIFSINKNLNEWFIGMWINQTESSMNVIKDHAGYLKSYLEGKMWTSRESAEENTPMQIQNAEIIINACENKLGE